MDFGRGLGGFGQAWGWQEGMKTGSNGDSSRNLIFQQFWTGFEGALGGVMGGLREGFGRVWLGFGRVWGHLGRLWGPLTCVFGAAFCCILLCWPAFGSFSVYF